MELLCKWCGETKQDVEFVKREASKPYSQSNVRNCKECNATRNRLRYQDPDIREKQLRANAKWRNEHREEMEKYTKKFYEKRPDQQRARNRVGYLVRSGILERQPCCVCGSEVQVEAHHDSYAKEDWDRVRWLCKDHHEEWHSVIDPLKKKVLGDRLQESERLRTEAKDVLKEVHRLRTLARSNLARAEAMEHESWRDVLKAIDGLFEAKFGVQA